MLRELRADGYLEELRDAVQGKIFKDWLRCEGDAETIRLKARADVVAEVMAEINREIGKDVAK